MLLKLIRLDIKNFLRSKSFGESLVMKISMFFIYSYFAAIFFGGAFALYFIAKEENQSALKLFSGYFIFYWMADLLLKYFMQQLPAENIKPFLIMNVTKGQLAKYTLFKIVSSFFTWSFLLFMVPFTILLLLDRDFDNFGVISVFFAAAAFLLINTFVNTIINKSNKLMYAVLGSVTLLAGLHFFKFIDLRFISENVITTFYQNPFLSFIILALMGGLGYFTYLFIRSNLYLDKGLEMRKSVGKTEDVAFLSRYGKIGTFINNDIKMIRRSKAAKSAFVGGFLFLFYGLLFYSNGYDNSFMMVFMGIFVTGGFNMMFGQRVPAWDSSYYPLMMTQNVPYKEFLTAKWSLFVIATAVCMVLSIGYALISWEYFFTIFAAGLYNLGVNSYLTLVAGAYNKKPIDLNSASKGFTSGQNNFNIKILLIMIPQMIVPMVVFSVIKYFSGLTPAVISLGLLGLIGFLLRDKIFEFIVRIYKTEKYSTIAAFKNVTS